jgi:hypothetical protein
MATVPTVLDPTAGDPLSASAFDAGVRDPLNWVLQNKPRVRVSNTAGLPITSGTILTWNQESYDTDTMHSTVTNTSRITFITAGMYIVSVTIQYPNATYTIQDVNVRVNSAASSTGGTGLDGTVGADPMNYQTARVPVFTFRRLFNANDYIEVFASVTPNNTYVQGPYRTFLEATWDTVS